MDDFKWVHTKRVSWGFQSPVSLRSEMRRVVLTQESQPDGKYWPSPAHRTQKPFCSLKAQKWLQVVGSTQLLTVRMMGSETVSGNLHLRRSGFHEQRGRYALWLGRLGPTETQLSSSLLFVCLFVSHAGGLSGALPSTREQCATKHGGVCCLTKWRSDTRVGLHSTMLSISL